MLKLNDVARNNKVVAYGFKALVDYASSHGSKGYEVIVSSLSPAVMEEMGVWNYYAPVLTRGAILNTAADVEAADLALNHVTVLLAPPASLYNNKVIVSRHLGTIEILKDMYPDAPVLSGNVTPDDIGNAFVIGTLPPHLIANAKAYQAVVIKDFDYSKDGDLSGSKLRDRIKICDPITVTID